MCAHIVVRAIQRKSYIGKLGGGAEAREPHAERPNGTHHKLPRAPSVSMCVCACVHACMHACVQDFVCMHACMHVLCVYARMCACI